MKAIGKMRNNMHKVQPMVVYAVYGLTEWIALIRVGKAKVRIPFTGGSLSGYGCTPATFVTASPALMRLIENSSHFKCGRILKITKI